MIIIQSSDISRYCNNQSDKTLQQDDTQPQDNQNTAIHTLQINSTENSLVLEKRQSASTGSFHSAVRLRLICHYSETILTTIRNSQHY